MMLKTFRSNMPFLRNRSLGGLALKLALLKQHSTSIKQGLQCLRRSFPSEGCP